MAQAIAMVHHEDPKISIQQEATAHLAGMTVLGARALVAVYVPPETTTRGGIYLPQTTLAESKFQGKVGLVLALGPIAFQEDATHRFAGTCPKIGDWVVFSVGDTFAMDLGKLRCRNVEDVDVHMIITDPDCIR